MNSRTTKVSIGLPVYNGEKYLARSIESILAQTFDDFDLIISDNGSTDATPEIGRDYAAQDSRIRFVREDVNRGATWNFNHVFHLSRGEYFKWGAHDDLVAPTYLARCVEVLDANPSVVWCQTRVGVVDGQGCAVKCHQPHELSGAAEVLVASDHCHRAQLADCSAMSYAHQRFRRVLLGNTSCFDVYGLIRSADLRRTSLWKPCLGWEKVLLGELALRGRCAEIPEELFLFRIHEDACSALSTANEQNTWCDPTAAKRNSLVRFHLLMGHIRAVVRAPLGIRDRALCIVWTGSYLCQFRKWPAVLRQLLHNQGIGGSTRETLKTLSTYEQQTGDVLELAGSSRAGPSHSTH